MSLSRILTMLAARKRADFIGWSDADEFATTAAAFAGGTIAGDFMVIVYYSSRTISGGSGTAFQTSTFTNTKVSSRVIEPGDLTNPINFSSNTPSIVGVWRGPTRLSASLSSLSVPGNVPGIIPSANALGILAVGNGGASSIYWNLTHLQSARTRPTSGIGYGAAELTNIEAYPAGTSFPATTDTGTGEGHIYELLT